MSFRYRYRKQIRLVIGIILLIIGSGTLLYLNLSSNKEQKEEKVVAVKNTKKEEPKVEKQETYMVDIKGEINNPGTYEVSKDNRVIDVISKAGGLTENANTSVINLSKKVTDEMVIIIYSNYQVEHFIEVKQQETEVIDKCINSEEVKNDACIESDTKEEISSVININTATKEELMTLSGIGESKANDIISYRETNGEFTKIEDIMNVSGIGEAVFAKIKDSITI